MDLSPDDRAGLKSAFRRCRGETELLAEPLSAEDQTIQTMPDVSPTKWHLAHTSWFFETFLLKPFLKGYAELDPAYDYLFNSYYEQIGDKWLRAERGLLSRPSVDEVNNYRAYITAAMEKLIDSASAANWGECYRRIVLGIHHEWQHQELLLTDIKHVMAYNPLRPAVYPLAEGERQPKTPLREKFIAFDGGIRKIGFDEGERAFHFDNETPQHEKLLSPFKLSARLITNGDYLEFMSDGGYDRVALWLSDGWAVRKAQNWDSPLYWRKDEHQGWMEYTLGGEIPIDKDCPVTHISFYEALAFAQWANKRLPLEEEIEIASANLPRRGNLGRAVEHGAAKAVHPEAADGGGGLCQIYGDGWEWTQSPYAPYPNYQAEKGAIGEYNGKFMCNQFVLKGGSCATPAGQVRPSYRNFFPPDARWQFTAIRLADKA